MTSHNDDGENAVSSSGTRDCVFSIIINGKRNPTSTRNTTGFYLRWLIIILNVDLEMAQIILTLESSSGKITRPTYRALTATTSSICLLLSATEIAHAMIPKKKARIGLPIWFGFISSSVQFSVNVTPLVVKRVIVNFDYLGLIFALCYFFAAMSGGRSGHMALVKCVRHGSSEAEGKFCDGMWVFEYSMCVHDQIKVA